MLVSDRERATSAATRRVVAGSSSRPVSTASSIGCASGHRSRLMSSLRRKCRFGQGRIAPPWPGPAGGMREWGDMGMRTECRHYESRSYAHGETVRKCRLDLAPEAPWRCPDACPMFEKRRFDAAWQYGSLTGAMAPTPAPEPQSLDDHAAALLDEA